MITITAEERNRIDKEGVLELIRINEERLKIWSLNKYEKEKIKAEIVWLKSLID